jgi:hypothetical protein
MAFIYFSRSAAKRDIMQTIAEIVMYLVIGEAPIVQRDLNSPLDAVTIEE